MPPKSKVKPKGKSKKKNNFKVDGLIAPQLERGFGQMLADLKFDEGKKYAANHVNERVLSGRAPAPFYQVDKETGIIIGMDQTPVYDRYGGSLAKEVKKYSTKNLKYTNRMALDGFNTTLFHIKAEKVYKPKYGLGISAWTHKPRYDETTPIVFDTDEGPLFYSHYLTEKLENKESFDVLNFFNETAEHPENIRYISDRYNTPPVKRPPPVRTGRRSDRLIESGETPRSQSTPPKSKSATPKPKSQSTGSKVIKFVSNASKRFSRSKKSAAAADTPEPILSPLLPRQINYTSEDGENI